MVKERELEEEEGGKETGREMWWVKKNAPSEENK